METPKAAKQRPFTRAVGANLAYWRKEKGLSLAELSARLDGIGLPMNLNGLHKIERGNRGVDIDELAAIARALNVPPLHLIFPIGRERTVEVLPETHMPTWLAAQWFAGETGFWTHVNGDTWGVTHEDNLAMMNSALNDFREQDAAVKEWRDSRRRADRAREAAAAASDPEERDRHLRLAQVDDEGRERITERSLRIIREHIRGWGLDPGELPPEMAHIDGVDDGQR